MTFFMFPYIKHIKKKCIPLKNHIILQPIIFMYNNIYIILSIVFNLLVIENFRSKKFNNLSDC